MSGIASRPKVLLFDVNETLLDLTPVKETVNRVLLDEHGAAVWFSNLLHHSLVMTVNGRYSDFAEIGAAVLQMLARNRDVVLSDGDARRTLAVMRSLPAHDDVRPALERLKRVGYRLAALTNSSPDGAQAQLGHAGLADCFERQLSVQATGKFKPDPAVYVWAAAEMRAGASECMLVAAHGWDIAGAKWAGMQAAFIAREGQQKFPLAPPPDVDVLDLAALANALAA